MFLKYLLLVGGDWNHGILWLSHHIGNVIIPTDDLIIFFRGVGWNHQPDFNAVVYWFFGLLKPGLYIYICIRIYIHVYIYISRHPGAIFDGEEESSTTPCLDHWGSGSWPHVAMSMVRKGNHTQVMCIYIYICIYMWMYMYMYVYIILHYIILHCYINSVFYLILNIILYCITYIYIEL